MYFHIAFYFVTYVAIAAIAIPIMLYLGVKGELVFPYVGSGLLALKIVLDWAKEYLEKNDPARLEIDTKKIDRKTWYGVHGIYVRNTSASKTAKKCKLFWWAEPYVKRPVRVRLHCSGDPFPDPQNGIDIDPGNEFLFDVIELKPDGKWAISAWHDDVRHEIEKKQRYTITLTAVSEDAPSAIQVFIVEPTSDGGFNFYPEGDASGSPLGAA